MRLLMQIRSPFACGIDGYYYALQSATFLKTGAFHLPDSSPVLFFLSGLSAAGDPVFMLKIGAAFLGALPVLPGGLLGSLISGRKGGGILLALLLSANLSLAYFSIELFKNLGALSFLLFALYFFLKLEAGERRPATVIGAVVFALLAVFSHRSTAVLAVLYGAVLVYRILPFTLRTKRMLLGGSIAAGATFLFLSGALHLSDAGRFSGVLSAVPGLPLLHKGLRFIFPLSLLLELTTAALVPWVLFLFRKRIPGGLLKAVWVSLFLLFLPFWKMEGAGMGFRLALVGAPLAAVLLFTAFHDRIRGKAAIATGILLMAMGLLLPGTVYRPETDPPYVRYRALLPHIRLPFGSVLICHRGLNLYYSYKTGNEGLSYIPDFTVPKEKLWRLAVYVEFEHLRLAAKGTSGLVQRLPFPYVLVREDVWQRYARGLSPEERSLLNNSYNPWKKKPWFLRRQQGR